MPCCKPLNESLFTALCFSPFLGPIKVVIKGIRPIFYVFKWTEPFIWNDILLFIFSYSHLSHIFSHVPEAPLPALWSHDVFCFLPPLPLASLAGVAGSLCTSCVMNWEVKDEMRVSTSHTYLCFSTCYLRGQTVCLEDFAFLNILSLSSPHLHSVWVSKLSAQLSSCSSLWLLLWLGISLMF